MNARRWRGWDVLSLSIFLVALGVRLWRLSDQSLWFDEAMSVYWASHPLSRVLRVGLTLSEDPHPPLYYVLLKPLLGWHPYEVSLRLPSVFAGALTAWAGAALARRLMGSVGAIVVGLALALNPTLVWYGQEARMYALATCLLVLALWALVVALDEGSSRAWAAYLLAALGALYSYVLSLIWFPAHAVLWLRRGLRKRRLVPGGLALGGVALGSLPLAWAAWSTSGDTVLPQGTLPPLAATLWGLWQAWVLGKRAGSGPWAGWATGVALAGLLLGLVWPGKRRRAWGVVATAVMPLLAGVLLAWRDPIVLAEVRYLLIALPGVVLAWGRAVQVAWEGRKWAGAGLALALIFPQLWALPANWAPEHRREDWRYAGWYLNTHAGPRDAVLIHPDYVRVALELYLDPQVPRFTPFHDVVRPEALSPPLEGLARIYDTVWLVESHTQTFDPNGLVRRWWEERFPLVTEQYPNGIVLKGFITRYVYEVLPPGVPYIGASFADGVVLVGCRVWEKRVQARDDRAHPPSGWVHVTLYWGLTRPVGEEVMPLVRLVDERGVWGERLQRPREVFRLYPPPRWRVGEIVRDEHDVNLNPLTPPGTYTLVVGLQRRNGPRNRDSGATVAPQSLLQRQVPLDTGEMWVTCDQVQVMP